MSCSTDPALAELQRARGTLAVAVKRRGGQTVLDRFRQEGCLKARLPRPETGAWTNLVTLNSSGGIAQGDRLDTAITAGPGTALTVASQAAERYYRSASGVPAQIRTALAVQPGAALEWLPQETILFEGCAVDRRLDITLAEDAWFLGVETLVFGRQAMGETLQTIRLRDTIRVHHSGRLAWQDAIRWTGWARTCWTARPSPAAAGRWQRWCTPRRTPRTRRTACDQPWRRSGQASRPWIIWS